MKIVVRTPNWIGDCIMCLPALRALKDLCPESEIYIVSREYLCDLYKGIEEIEGIIPIPSRIDSRNIFKTARELKTFNFDRGVLFTNSFNSALLFRLAGIGNLTGYEKDYRGFMLGKKLKFPKNEKHHVYFYLDLVAEFCEKKIAREYPGNLCIAGEEKEKVIGVLQDAGIDGSAPLVGISPSAAYGTAKQWLPGRFGELIAGLKEEIPGCSVLLFGARVEREKIQWILDEHQFKEGVFNLAGRLTLREALATISLCRVFISNDSGLMHAASSLDVPLVAIFGPTQPQKTAPRSRAAAVLHHPVDCAPCKHRDCPIDHRCMTAVTKAEVLDSVKRVLSL